MAKKLADKWDDTVRPGGKLGYRPEEAEGFPWGVFIRVFESERMAMSPWTLKGEMTPDESKARSTWEETVSATKSGAVMCCALIRVTDVAEPRPRDFKPDQYLCTAVCVEVRASHLLRDGKQSGKDQAPDGYDLSRAVDDEFNRFMVAKLQVGDDAAKDIAHATANGTPDPTPENTSHSGTADEASVILNDDGKLTGESTGLPVANDVLTPENGNTRGKGKGKVKVSKP